MNNTTPHICPICTRKLLQPPTLDTLIAAYPSIRPIPIDRSLPRCRRCDEFLTRNLAISAECPPPEHINPVRKLEKDIQRMEELRAEGVMKKELEFALPFAHGRLAEAIRERDRRIKEVWDGFWGVWGLLRGQELL